MTNLKSPFPAPYIDTLTQDTIAASQLDLLPTSPLVKMVRLAIALTPEDQSRSGMLQRFVDMTRLHKVYLPHAAEMDDLFGIAYLVAAHRLANAQKLMKLAYAENLMTPVYKKWAGRGIVVAQADHAHELSHIAFSGHVAETRHIIEIAALARAYQLNNTIVNHKGGLIAEQFELLEMPVRILRCAILAEGVTDGRPSTSAIVPTLIRQHEMFLALRKERLGVNTGHIPTTMSQVRVLKPRPS